MVSGLSLFFFIIIVPAACGTIYRIACRDTGDIVLADIWSKGWLLMLAVFSAIYSYCRIFGIEWDNLIWLGAGAVISLAAVIIIIAMIYRRRSKEEKPEEYSISLIRGDLLPVYILVAALYLITSLLIMHRDPHEHVYIYEQTYKYETADEETGMVYEPGLTDVKFMQRKDELLILDLNRFHLTLNELTGISPYVFLLVIIPLVYLFLSVACFDMLGERFGVEQKNRYVFLMLIYIIFLVTLFCRDYYLYDIYSRIWEPETLFTAFFMPFRLGMMIYIHRAVYNSQRSMYGKCICWSVASYLIGCMFPWKDLYIMLAPEIVGIVSGILRRRVRFEAV